jgi:hypothetical protein
VDALLVGAGGVGAAGVDRAAGRRGIGNTEIAERPGGAADGGYLFNGDPTTDVRHMSAI